PGYPDPTAKLLISRSKPNCLRLWPPWWQREHCVTRWLLMRQLGSKHR
ncbi:hypothetical protein LCGC14_3077050, partial [marine sediment metagenome]